MSVGAGGSAYVLWGGGLAHGESQELATFVERFV